jgi:DNA repair exonuclease SbcCD ATPase subunit
MSQSDMLIYSEVVTPTRNDSSINTSMKTEVEHSSETLLQALDEVGHHTTAGKDKSDLEVEILLQQLLEAAGQREEKKYVDQIRTLEEMLEQQIAETAALKAQNAAQEEKVSQLETANDQLESSNSQLEKLVQNYASNEADLRQWLIKEEISSLESLREAKELYDEVCRDYPLDELSGDYEFDELSGKCVHQEGDYPSDIQGGSFSRTALDAVVDLCESISRHHAKQLLDA